MFNTESRRGTPVIKGEFRWSAAKSIDILFSIDIYPSPDGLDAVRSHVQKLVSRPNHKLLQTVTREGVTGRRSFTKILCPSIDGFYQNVPEKESSNFLEFAAVCSVGYRNSTSHVSNHPRQLMYSTVAVVPPGVTYDSKTYFWFGRWEKNIIFKARLSPTFAATFPFRFGEKRTVRMNGKIVHVRCFCFAKSDRWLICRVCRLVPVHLRGRELFHQHCHHPQ